MTEVKIIACIAAGPPVVAALIAGLFAWRANKKANANAADIQEYKSATDRDLERLKAKLEHGQLISTTQWNAEFAAYRAMWKTIIPVRAWAIKLVLAESDLAEHGLAAGDYSEAEFEPTILAILQRYGTALSDCVKTINERAPFYPADIRESANKMHSLGNRIHKTQTAAFVERKKTQRTYSEQAKAAGNEYIKELRPFLESVDEVEERIRKRLAGVQVLP